MQQHQHPLTYYVPLPSFKVYLVARHSACMAGIEQLSIMYVPPSAQKAFLKHYGRCIVLQGSSAEQLLALLNESPGG